MIPVKYHTEESSYRLVKKRTIATWLQRVARTEGYEMGEVNYVFCSSRRVLEMNRQYLGHNYFTDVITFDYSDREDKRIVSGDVFIDVETVFDNARQYHSTTKQEMRRVIVHGVLHLCGQNDKTSRTSEQMHRKEDKYLKFWENEDWDAVDWSHSEPPLPDDGAQHDAPIVYPEMRVEKE